MFWSKSDNARIDAFGKELAGELSRRVPLATIADPGKKGNDRYVRAIEHARGVTIAFQKDNKLGVYGKARLLNTFKWELKRQGYSDEFIDGVTDSLVNLTVGPGISS